MSTLEVSADADSAVAVESTDEIRRAIDLLFRSGDVVEVRVPKAGRQKTISGYFQDFESLARAIERIEEGRYPGVYWTANPVNPALLARADHKLKSFADLATSDADILCRRLMVVDLDPKRPAGISSSDPEHAAALDLARQIRGELQGAGWPEPIFADSGNGAHLLYPVELPNDAETADLLKRCLRALAARFNHDVVAVDEGMYNASRIIKAYGTTARKGDDTEDRPHRLSRILEPPSSLVAVNIELLRALAAQAPEKPYGRVVAMPRATAGSFDLEEFLKRHGVRYRPAVNFDGARKFVLEVCAFDPSHRAPDAAVFEAADGRLGYHCFHNSCQGRTWRDFREMFEPTDRNTRAIPQLEDPDAHPWGEVAEWWLREDMPVWSRHYLEEQVRKIEKEKKWQWVDSCAYTNREGAPVLAKVRFLDRANDKTYRQFVLTAKRGWRLRRPGEARDLLYRWPTLAEPTEIFVVTGEALADYAAQRLGVATTCHIDGEWHGALNDTFRDKLVVLAATNDEKGRQHAALVTGALHGVAREIRLLRIPGLPPKGGLQEWIDAGGTVEQLRQILERTEPLQQPVAMASVAPARVPSWRDALLFTDKGEPRALLANVITALRGAPEWDGVLWRDEFSLRTVARKPAPWGEVPTWSEREDGLTTDWLQHQGIRVSKEVAGQGIEVVAGDRPFHPVREYLESLSWDGIPRLHDWLHRYLGVELTPYSAAVGSRWMISGVARIYVPGCKADCCLILEGPQGIKKSTAFRTLAEPWFIDHVPDLGTKDALIQVHSAWVIELAELDTISRADVSSIKQFISTPIDTFRPPYGHRAADFPRQCIFAGSVNHNTYLRDETGGRRFWPVACKAPVIDIDALAAVRDQLWAEAVFLFHEGRTWWMDTPELSQEAEQEQAARYEDDPWDELIVRWTEGRDTVSVVEVLTSCLEKRKDQWTQLDKNRVARCLRSRGWIRYKARQGDGREWRYQRP